MTNKNKDYGEPIPYDQAFSGPVAIRAVTDAFFCIIFIIALSGYLMLGVAALIIGNPQYTINEQNSTGEFCGIGINVDKPHVFYFDTMKCASAVNVTAATFKGLLCPTTQVCVKQCPSAFWFLPPEAFTAGAIPHDIFQQEFCDPGLHLAQTTLTVQEILDKELCPAYYTPSKPFLGKCLPSFHPNDVPSDFIVPGSTSANKAIKSIIYATRFLRSGFDGKYLKVRIIEDLAVSWYWILIGLVIALMISMVLLLLLRYYVSGVFILLIVGVLSVGAYGIYQCFQEYQISMNSQLTPGDLSLHFKLSNYLQVKRFWLACLVILCLLEVLLLMLLVSCLRKGFIRALAIFGECSKAISVLWSTVVYPVVIFLLVTLCMTFTTVSSVNLATSGLPGYNIVTLDLSNAYCGAITSKLKCDPKTFKASDYPKCPVRCVFQYTDDDDDGFFVHFLHSYNLLICLLCLHFIITLGQCALARTFSAYYWSMNTPENVDRCTLFKAFFQMLRYHVGSMAYGAVFVTMFQGIRIVLEYLKDVTKGKQRCYCCYPLKMLLKTCFCGLNKVIKYFNRNTYIMIAVYGENYFAAAKNAHMLRGRNKDRVVTVDWVTDLLLFFGRILVAGIVGALAFCFFSGDIFQAELLNYRWLPCIILMVGAYFIAQGCFSVYSMGVDTFTLCVMEDLERNNGTMQRPYMSRSIMQILRQQSDSV